MALDFIEKVMVVILLVMTWPALVMIRLTCLVWGKIPE